MPFGSSASHCGEERRPASPSRGWSKPTGWDPALVAQGIAQVDEPRFVARLVPAGIDRDEIEATAAGVKATARLSELTREILDDVLGDGTGAPEPRDLDELHRRLDATWND